MKYMVTLVGSSYAGKSSIIGSFMRGSPYQSKSVDLEDGCYKEIHLKNDQSINQSYDNGYPWTREISRN